MNIFRAFKAPPRVWFTAVFRADGQEAWQRPIVILREGNWFTKLFHWAVRIDVEMRWEPGPPVIVWISQMKDPPTSPEIDRYSQWLADQFALPHKE